MTYYVYPKGCHRIINPYNDARVTLCVNLAAIEIACLFNLMCREDDAASETRLPNEKGKDLVPVSLS